MERYANAVRPGTPEFHRYLHVAAFGCCFRATEATVRSTTAALGRLGLNVAPGGSNRLIVSVSGDGRDREHAFATTLVRYRLGSGALVYTNLSAPRSRPLLPERSRRSRAERLGAVASGGYFAPGASAGARRRAR